MGSLAGKKLFVVMRHENSISAVWGFVSGLGLRAADFHFTVMERHIDTPQDFQAKKDKLIQAIGNNGFDALVLATKINDVDDNSQLVPFLEELRDAGLRQKPVVLTHLTTFTPDQKSAFNALGLNLHLVETDNLGMPKPTDKPEVKRTGMSKLGPAILQVL